MNTLKLLYLLCGCLFYNAFFGIAEKDLNHGQIGLL